MDMVLTVISIVLGLGAIGAWLVSAGKRMAEQEQTKKDLDGMGRKVEHIRKETKEELMSVRIEHKELCSKVDEISRISIENNTLLGAMNTALNRLLDSHLVNDGR